MNFFFALISMKILQMPYFMILNIFCIFFIHFEKIYIFITPRLQAQSSACVTCVRNLQYDGMHFYYAINMFFLKRLRFDVF